MNENSQDIGTARSASLSTYGYWAALLLLASVPFIGLLKGQFLYDDFIVILLNRNLHKIHAFSECFSFVLKPSKPVTNYLIALGQWFGSGRIFTHRAISIAVHMSVTLLLFENLRLLIRRLDLNVPPALPFWISFDFRAPPDPQRAAGDCSFPNGYAGAMFSLLALWSLQRLLGEEMKWGQSTWRLVLLLGLLFVSMGLAQLSKEVFAATLPLTLAAFTLVRPRSGWRRGLLPAVFVMELVWAIVLVSLLRLDSRSEFPYREVIGYGVQSPATQIPLAARALMEGAAKAVTGHGLTILPVRVRQGLGAGMGLGMALAFLATGVGLVGLLWRAGGWWRAWGTTAGAGIFIYLLIPNLNIGSEHYWYFPLMGLVSLGGLALWRFFERSVRAPQLWMGLTVVVYAAALALGLEARLKVLHSRMDLYLSEVTAHPESAPAWSAVITTILEKPGPESARLARPFVEQAKRIAPDDPTVLTAEFTYLLSARDRYEAERTLRRIELLFPGRPKTIADYEFHLGLLIESLGDCAGASAAYARAGQMDSQREDFRGALERTRGLGCAGRSNLPRPKTHELERVDILEVRIPPLHARAFQIDLRR